MFIVSALVMLDLKNKLQHQATSGFPDQGMMLTKGILLFQKRVPWSFLVILKIYLCLKVLCQKTIVYTVKSNIVQYMISHATFPPLFSFVNAFYVNVNLFIYLFLFF